MSDTVVNSINDNLFSLNPDDIEILAIIEPYLALNFGDNLSKSLLLELIVSPNMKLFLFRTLKFWHLIPHLLGAPKEHSEKIYDHILKHGLEFAVALSTISLFSKKLKITKLQSLTNFNLFYLLQIISHAYLTRKNDNNKITELLFSIISIISSIAEQPLFDSILREFKVILETENNKNDIITLLHNIGLYVAVDSITNLKAKNNINNQHLLQLFNNLNMLIGEMQMTMHTDHPQQAEIINYWQDLVDQFATLQEIDTKQRETAYAANINFIKTESNEQNPVSSTSRDALLTERTEKLIADLNDANFFKAADELQDLLLEIRQLNSKYNNLVTAKQEKPKLPPILTSKDQINPSLTDLNQFENVNIKLNKIANSWLQLTIGGNKLFKVIKTNINLAACPRYINIPGFKGKLLIAQDGSLIIEHLPNNINYKLEIDNDLNIKKLNINGKIQAKVRGGVVNNDICVAAGGILLDAKTVDNRDGVFTTFNIPNNKIKKLSKYLAQYRMLKSLSSQTELSKKQLNKILIKLKKYKDKYKLSLISGQIHIKTREELNNYNGNILTGDNCSLKHGSKLDNRNGVIASHNAAVDLLSLGTNGELLSTNNGIIWAATNLSAKAPKITKDDVGIMQGLLSTNLRSFDGNLRDDGYIVSNSKVELTQDRGVLNYSKPRLKADSLKVTTATTSNILEQKINTKQLEITVTDPNSYLTTVKHKLSVEQQIVLQVPQVETLEEITAGDKIAIHTPTIETSESLDNALNKYSVKLNKKLTSKEVIVTGHGVEQTSNNAKIYANNVGVATNNIKLPAGIIANDTALLHVTNDVNYDPDQIFAKNWTGLHLPLVNDFKISSKTLGSLYAKVLADHESINLPQDINIQKHIIVDAADSMFGCLEDVERSSPSYKLHTGDGGKILLLAKSFNLTQTGIYGDRGVNLLATAEVECGTVLPKEQLEPYIFTNGTVAIATSKDQEILLRHMSINAMENGFLQAKQNKHIGVNLNIYNDQGGLAYDGQPIAEYVSERSTEPKESELVLRSYGAMVCGVKLRTDSYRHYKNWEKILSRRSIINCNGKLNLINNTAPITGSYVELNHGYYVGSNHNLTEAKLKALVYNTATFYHDCPLGTQTFPEYEYEYDAVKPIYQAHGATEFVFNQPATIDYNMVLEQSEMEIGDNKLIVGNNLALSKKSQLLELDLSKIVNITPTEAYIKVINKNNLFAYQPIFPISFDRPNLDIIIVDDNGNYIKDNPNKYFLSHPFIEMQFLLKTIHQQLGHKQIGETGLSNKEIYYYMLANALEHANSGKSFLAADIIRPMLVYKKIARRSLQLESLLPKILDIPELRANVGGIFSRLLKVGGTAASAIDLLGAIFTKEGHRLDVGKLSILQQYRENRKYLFEKTTKRDFWGSTETTETVREVIEREAIDHTGVLKAIKGNTEINVVEFISKGGKIVCLDGNTFIKVEKIIDIVGLVNINYKEHYSSAKTLLNKKSTYSFVERQQLVPFQLITPNGTFNIICQGKIYAEAIGVLAKSGYVYGKDIIELNASKLWQEIGATHIKKGMVLSTIHGATQTATPCSFYVEEGVLFETSPAGVFKDTGSQFDAGGGSRVRAGEVQIQPIKLESRIYRKSSGLMGFAYIKERSVEDHVVNQGSRYLSKNGDIIFHALTKDVTACAVTSNAPQGKAKFIADQGKVNILQATDSHNIFTNSKNIGYSFTMSDAIVNAIRGDLSKALKSATSELKVVNAVNDLLSAEGVLDQTIKSIYAANGIVQSLLQLQSGGIMGFLSGNLSQHIELTLSNKQKSVHFEEIVGNWLLAKEIIIQAKQDINIQAINADCADLDIKSKEGTINVDGGEANSSSSLTEDSVSLGVRNKSPNCSVTNKNVTRIAKQYGMSKFNVTGKAYISALKGDVCFRNAVLAARKAYIEAIHLSLESQRDDVLEKFNSYTVGTSLGFSKGGTMSKWVQEQTGIKVSEHLNIAIEQGTALIGSFVEVGTEATPIEIKLPNGEIQHLHILLLPADSESSFKTMGVPRAKAICQLFAVADDIEFRKMLGTEILNKFLNKELPEIIAPPKNVEDMTTEELIEWATSKECYENYLGFYLALESTALTLDNNNLDRSSMAAIAKLNNLQLRIFSNQAENDLKFIGETNVNSEHIVNIAVKADGNYTRLSDKPGMLISPQFSYSDVESTYDNKELGVSLNNLLYGDIVGKIKYKKAHERQINFAYLSNNINLQSENKGPASTAKQGEFSSKKYKVEISSDLLKTANELTEGISALKEQFNKHNVDLQQAESLASTFLEQERIRLEQQKQLAKEQKTNNKAKQRLFEQTPISPVLLTNMFNVFIKNKINADDDYYTNRRIIAKHGLIESEAKTKQTARQQANLFEKALDLIIPGAYAAEAPKDSSVASSTREKKSSNTIKNILNIFKEMSAAPYEDILEKYQYDTLFDVIEKHGTALEHRDDFNPGNVVTSNTVRAGVATEQYLKTTAYDLATLSSKNKDFSVGLTPYAQTTGTINPLEVNNLQHNYGAQASFNIGVNVLHLDKEQAAVNANLFACSGVADVNKTGASVQGECSLAQVNVNASVGPVCVLDRCLQASADGTVTVGTVKGQAAVGERKRAEFTVNSGVGYSGQLNVEITKKPKPN